MAAIERLLDLLDGALRVFAALCLLVLLGLVGAQVFLRYGIGSVPFFMEEVARYGMIWMALAATAIAVREASHISVEFVPAVLMAQMPALGRALHFALDLIALAVFFVLIWYGIDMMRFAAGQTSEGMRIPLSIPYGALPTCFALAAIFAVARLLTGSRQS